MGKDEMLHGGEKIMRADPAMLKRKMTSIEK
jgi:hypothetical protein